MNYNRAEVINLIVAILVWTFLGFALTANGETFKPNNTTPIKIAIIDTGYALGSVPNLKLCMDGHYNFETGQPKLGVSSKYPDHGIKVASIIADALKDVDYCIIFYQIQRPLGISIFDVALAASMAASHNVVAVNISLSGISHNITEFRALYMLSNQAKLFLVAGNNNLDLKKNCIIFPACYKIPLATVVGALDGEPRAAYSNYNKGLITTWEQGSITWRGTKDAGTSYAAPRALSRYVLSFVSARHVAVRQ